MKNGPQNIRAVSEQGPLLTKGLIECLHMDGRACDEVPLAGPVWLTASRKPDSRALIQRDSEAQKCHQVPWQRTHACFVSQAAVDGGLKERKPLHSSPSGNQSTPCLILCAKASSRWSGVSWGKRGEVNGNHTGLWIDRGVQGEAFHSSSALKLKFWINHAFGFSQTHLGCNKSSFQSGGFCHTAFSCNC